MKLGQWVVLALIAFVVSGLIGAYQSYQSHQPISDAVLVSKALILSSNSGSPDITASNINADIGFNSSDETTNMSSPDTNDNPNADVRETESNPKVWLLEFPQHWVQNGDCQVRGTLKTLLVQRRNTLSGRLHWVWNGQNDAAIFTGQFTEQASNPAVQLQMTPPAIGGFEVLFSGRKTNAGVIEGRALAKSVCKGRNGRFMLTALTRPRPASDASVLPLFEKPFDDEYLISNYFDHDQPRQFVDNNGYLTNWEGNRLALGNPGAGIDGHGGYDWGVPEKTPLKAVADGVVTFAGEGASFFCPPLQQETTGKYVYILHTAPNGDQFETEYVHLHQVDVKQGDRVISGQTIGLSGNTGCSTGPHLHFGVRKVTDAEINDRILVDPYGWNPTHADPWNDDVRGTESVWLWKPNQSPILYEYDR